MCIAKAHVIQPGRRAHAHALAGDLNLAMQIRQACRKAARGKLLALLQHSHPLASLRQARGSNTSAIPRTNDHHVVVRAQAAQRLGKARQGNPRGRWRTPNGDPLSITPIRDRMLPTKQARRIAQREG
jgi:hypothetical protein